MRSLSIDPARRVRWSVVALAAVVALLVQSVVLQSHIHPRAGLDLRASSAASGDHRVSAPGPAECPQCRELARAGTYLPPTAIAMIHPIEAFAPPRAAPVRIANPAQRSHAWRSRGPPRGTPTPSSQA